MYECFDIPVDRRGIGNMKGAMTDAVPHGSVMLSGAEMDYATAPMIRNALAGFAQRGLYGFTLPDELYLESVCAWMRRVRGMDAICADMIVPTMGTTFALSTAVRVFTAPGEGVIIQHPSYYRFDRAILRNGRKVISNLLRESDGVYSLDLADLETKMANPQNRLLVLCNPHNPTGRVFDKEDLEAIARMAKRYDVVVFSDEIFAETADPAHPVIPYVSIDTECGITSTSLGKAFNFTGVNQANLIIPSAALRERYVTQRDQDHFGSIDPFFYTALRAAYTEDGHQWLSEMNLHTRRNYELIRLALAEKMPLLSVFPLEATYVAWIDCRKLRMDDRALQTFWEGAGIFIDPGDEYGPGGSGFVRLNIAVPTPWIEEMLHRLQNAYNKLNRKDCE